MSAPAEHHPLHTLHPDCDGRTTCHTTAEFVTFVHQVDCCERQGLTPDGASVLLLCQQCLEATAALIERDITRRTSRMPRGAVIGCKTCRRPVSGLHDVLEAEVL